MNTILRNAALFFFVLFFASSLAAGEKHKNISDNKFDIVEDNLLVGLTSDNFGLKTSSAYFLGEYKSSKAVIPLMRILMNEDEDVRARIIAALSLYKIDDLRGIYKIKLTSLNSENERLKNLAEKFYFAYLLKEQGYDTNIEESTILEAMNNAVNSN